jgi:Carboxypeptidase regulatory-like domain
MIPTKKHLGALFLVAITLFGLATLVTVAPPAHAQAISGDITGVVADANNAVIPRASIEAKNVATGVSYAASTNEVGAYRFSNLPAGLYDLTITAKGFTTSVLKGFRVELNKISTENVTLSISAATETVQVSAAAVALDTTTAQVQTSFDTQQLVTLPATANQVLNMSLMTAGVGSSGGMGDGTGPSVGGQRPRSNNYTVEGIDNNNKSVTGPLVYVPSDAVSEFTAMQNQFSAEFGHSNGGQFNQIIKSGTNSFHGVAYEYSQNRNYNAIDASVARAQGYQNVVKPRYDDNRFGGQVGGPIKRNKLFFFSNYEQEPYGAPGTTASFCAPTAPGFSTLDSISGLSSTNLTVFKQYSPVAATQATPDDQLCPQTISVGGQSIPVGDVGVIAGTFLSQWRTINSVDYTISDKDSLRGRYLYNKSDGPDAAATFPSFWVTQPARYHLVTLSEFHTFTPSLSSEFRIGYNRYYNVTPAPGTFPGLTSFPNITINDLNAVNIGPDPNAPQGTVQNTYQGSEGIIWNKGRHTLKIGAEYRDVISPQLFIQRARGDYQYSALDVYLHDVTPDYLGERNATAPGVSPTYYGNQQVAYAYFQDDFHVTRDLTLNLGVRYEYTGVTEGAKQQVANIDASVPGLITFGVPKSQKLNFVPRLGFAYSIDPKTVVRGGFGMGYDVLYDNLGILSAAPQYQVTEEVDYNNPVTGFLAGGGLPQNVTIPDLETQRALTTAYIPDQKLPYAENWSLGVERTFGQNYTAEVRYLGTRGIHLPTQNRLNRQTQAFGSNSLPVFFSPTSITDPSALTLTQLKKNRPSLVPQYSAAGFTSSIVGFMPYSESNYNGMATQLTRRFANGLLFNAAYTWSKTMDDATASVFSTYLTPRRPQDHRNVAGDYSRSALDHTNRLTFATVYDLPFFSNSSALLKNTLGNWEIAPAYTYQSPEYATVQSGTDANLNGDSAGDRTFINPNGKKGTGTGVSPVYNPSLANLCGTDDNGDPISGCSANLVAYQADDPNAYYVAGAAGTLPTNTRNTLPIRPINNFDLSVVKSVSIKERYKFQFGAGAWNVLNHSQYLPGSVNNINSIGYTNGATLSYLVPSSTTFNNPEATFSNNARTMQLFAKFMF